MQMKQEITWIITIMWVWLEIQLTLGLFRAAVIRVQTMPPQTLMRIQIRRTQLLIVIVGFYIQIIEQSQAQVQQIMGII